MSEETAYPNIQNFQPSTCISGKMRRCNRMIANVFRKHIAQFQITDSQLSILFILSKMSDVNQKKLSEILVLEKSTTNRNLKRLFEKDFVAYENGSQLLLTTQGKQAVEEIIPHWQKAMEEIREILASSGEDSLNTLLLKLSQSS